MANTFMDPASLAASLEGREASCLIQDLLEKIMIKGQRLIKRFGRS